MSTYTERAIRLRILKLRWNAIRAARRATKILEDSPGDILDYEFEICPAFVLDDVGSEWDRRRS